MFRRYYDCRRKLLITSRKIGTRGQESADIVQKQKQKKDKLLVGALVNHNSARKSNG